MTEKQAEEIKAASEQLISDCSLLAALEHKTKDAEQTLSIARNAETNCRNRISNHSKIIISIIEPKRGIEQQ